MSKYLGMSLKGEVRESISLDEDDISDDVEDEVFIRQGRHGFKVQSFSFSESSVPMLTYYLFLL